jgi:plasmid stabilization system protein ParE
VTLRVIFHDRAEEELNEAAGYYERARPGLGDAFLAEVHRAVEALLAAHLAGAVMEGDVRRWLVKRFPYSVVYRISDDHVRILAIAHQKRRSFYWRRRR